MAAETTTSSPGGAGADLRRRIETRLDHLPVLPLAIAKLMAMDPADEAYFDDVVRLLESEPNFASRLFLAANSAASAPTNPVSTIRGAVARIGSRSATSLVLALAVTTVFVPRDPWETGLWRHGVQVAHACRALAELAHDPELDPELLYASALLHDIGRFVLFQVDPERLRLVDEGTWDSPEALVDYERSICGLTHPEIGAIACRKWGLPPIFVNTVRNHHDPLPATFTTAEQKITALVRLADVAMFPSTDGERAGLHEEMDDEALTACLEPAIPSFLHVDGQALRSLIAGAANDADEACRSLGLGVGG